MIHTCTALGVLKRSFYEIPLALHEGQSRNTGTPYLFFGLFLPPRLLPFQRTLQCILQPFEKRVIPQRTSGPFMAAQPVCLLFVSPIIPKAGAEHR